MPDCRLISRESLQLAIDQWNQGNDWEMYDLLYNVESKGFTDGCNYVRDGLLELLKTKLHILHLL